MQTEYSILVVFATSSWGFYALGYPDAAILAALTMLGAFYIGGQVGKQSH